MKSKHIPVDDTPFSGIPITEEVGKPGFNSHGYDTVEFGSRKNINILSLGCSWTQGNKVNGSFSGYLTQFLQGHYSTEVQCWNMGLGGRSADYIVRTLLCCIDVLKPEAVVILFPSPDRRERFRNDGKKIRYQLDWIGEEQSNGPHWQQLSSVEKHLMRVMNELVSPYDDSVNFLKNFKIIETTLQLRGIPWCFSMVPVPSLVETVNDLIEVGWIKKDNYLGTPFIPTDYVSPTDGHPGTESHKAFGKLIADWLIAKYDLRFRSRLDLPLV